MYEYYKIDATVQWRRVTVSLRSSHSTKTDHLSICSTPRFLFIPIISTHQGPLAQQFQQWQTNFMDNTNIFRNKFQDHHRIHRLTKSLNLVNLAAQKQDHYLDNLSAQTDIQQISHVAPDHAHHFRLQTRSTIH